MATRSTPSPGLWTSRAALVTTTVVALHLLLHAAHGAVHEVIPVRIAAWQTGFVVGVIFLLPVVALACIHQGRRRLGAGALVGAGIAALGFEGTFHFLVENPDHVHAVADGNSAFVGTTGLAAVADVLLVLAGVWFYRRSS